MVDCFEYFLDQMKAEKSSIYWLNDMILHLLLSKLMVFEVAKLWCTGTWSHRKTTTKDRVAWSTLPLDDRTDYDGAQITGVPETTCEPGAM